MQVAWKVDDLRTGPGHGVVFYLIEGGYHEALGFIDGFSWLHEKDPEVVAVLDKRLRRMPRSITVELQLAILLFLTDKARQTGSARIHGFGTGFNA
jgi:hypothetical protein